MLDFLAISLGAIVGQMQGIHKPFHLQIYGPAFPYGTLSLTSREASLWGFHDLDNAASDR